MHNILKKSKSLLVLLFSEKVCFEDKLQKKNSARKNKQFQVQLEIAEHGS